MIVEKNIESPIPEIQIGTLLDYSGIYVNDKQEGSAKVKRIYKDVFVDDTTGLEWDDNGEYETSVWAKLEYTKEHGDGKLVLLGFEKGDSFRRIILKKQILKK